MNDMTPIPSTKIDFIYLSEDDMIRAGVTDMPACVDAMEEMFGLLYHGDYRMAGPNSDSHGAAISFRKTRRFPTCRSRRPTDASWPCLPISAAASARPA